MDASLMANEVLSSSGYSDSALLSIHEEERLMRSLDALDGPEQFNFHQSFGVMTGRRLQRRYRGVYQRYSFITHLVTWLIIITVVVFAALDSASDSERMSRSNDLLYLATIVLVLYILVQLALIVRWIIYWIILAMLLTYAITGNFYVLFSIDGVDLTDSDRHVGYVMLIVLFSVEGITIAAYWFTHYAYPWLVSHQKFDLESWWNIRPGVETNTLTYLSKARFYKRERSVIRYCGGLNAQNQPHGYGMWTDTSYHGERLTGQWKDGNPIGPFRSFEHGSGYSFVNLRVGFCHNRAEKSPTKAFFLPKHSENGLNWGVASAECSVSGGFFKYLPAVTYLTLFDEDKAPQSATECLSVLRTPTDSVVFNHHDDAMGRTQHFERRATRRHLLSEKSAPVLDYSCRDNDNCKEALVLLHGYSCALDYGIQRLAQLLALGDFPSYIHPFVFSWPSGGVLAYYQAKEIGSEGERTAHDFILFLQSLTDAGYTKLNIIAHSMGARVFFSSLNKGLFDQVFLPTGSNCNVNVTLNKLELSTLILCNPDYDRNEFVKYGGGYDRARHFCSHITLYADSMDGALFYSEFLLKKSIASPLNYSLGRRGHMIHRDPEDDESTNRSDPLFPIWQNKDLSPPQDLDQAYAAVNQRANYSGLASFAYNRSKAQSTDVESTPYGTPRSGSRKQDALVHYLDMDVIDTTWMDNNVHAIRHNYFNLNPTIVDDLRHLIVFKNRASCRPGLLKTTSAENVHIFLVAPSHVKNK